MPFLPSDSPALFICARVRSQRATPCLPSLSTVTRAGQSTPQAFQGWIERASGLLGSHDGESQSLVFSIARVHSASYTRPRRDRSDTSLRGLLLVRSRQEKQKARGNDRRLPYLDYELLRIRFLTSYQNELDKPDLESAQHEEGSDGPLDGGNAGAQKT